MDINALPQPPQITEEELKDFDAGQKRLASTHPVMHGGDIFLQRAYAVINELSTIKDSLTVHQLADLADAYATVGMFDDAVKLNTEKATEFQQIINAVNTKERCGCPDVQTVQIVDGKAEQISIPHTFTLNRVYVNGEWIPLYKCNNCGLLST